MSYLFPTYKRWDVNIEKANGAKVMDTEGKEYIDFTSGIGVCNLGHCHPEVVNAVNKQTKKVWHVSNLFKIPLQEQVATKLVQETSGDAVFFCNSGAEANEAAIKLARKFTGKSKIITFEQSFHGRTLGTMAATGQEKVKVGFGKMLETFIHVPYNDIDVLKETIDSETAAVMLEVIQGEGGVHPADELFLKEVERLCQSLDVLLIVDEIQTGIGRTGKSFAYQHYGIQPDIITVAKGLGNGFPVGAMIGKKELIPAFTAGSHGSTFGGNPLAMAAANATLNIVFDQSFLKEVEKKGNILVQQLNEFLPQVKSYKKIKHKGLMIGIEFQQETTELLSELRENGLLALNAGPNVMRLLPPLTITMTEIHEATAIMRKVLQKQIADTAQ